MSEDTTEPIQPDGKPDPKIKQAFIKLGELFNDIPHRTNPPEELSQKQVVAVIIVSKTMRTSKALYELWRHGLAEDMTTLKRGVLESMVLLQYLHEKGTEQQAEQFSARAAVKSLRMAERMIRHYPNSRSAQLLKKELPELKRQADHAKTYMNIGNNLPNRHHMASAIGFKEFDFLWDDFSAYDHPDGYSSSGYVRKEEDGWKVLLEQPNYDKANAVAALALAFIVGVIKYYNLLHDLQVPDKDFDSVLDIFSPRERAESK